MKKISITEITLWLYIILLPFSLGNPARLGVNIKLCDFLFPLFAISFLIENRHEIPSIFKKSKIFLAFLPFIFAGFLSFFNSVDIGKSILELTAFLYLFVLSFMVASFVNTKERFYRILKAWLFATGLVLVISLGGFVLSIVGNSTLGANLTQHSGLDKTFTPFARIKGPFYSPNMLLTYLHVSIVLAICYFYTFFRKRPAKPLARAGLLSFIFLIFAGAFLTLSRRFSGMLLSLFLIMRKLSAKKIITYTIFLAFVGFLILTVATTVWQIFPVKYSHVDGEKPEFLINKELSVHLLPHVVSLRMFMKYPLIGSGIGNYNLVFTDFYSPKEVLSKYDADRFGAKDLIAKHEYASDPHCAYLGLLAEMGLFGFIAFFMFLAVFFHYVLVNYREISKDVDKKTIYVLMCGVIGFLANGLTTDILTMRHFWILMALIVGFISTVQKQKGVHEWKGT